MIPFIIAGAVGFGIAKLLEKDTKKFAKGGGVDDIGEDLENYSNYDEFYTAISDYIRRKENLTEKEAEYFLDDDEEIIYFEFDEGSTPRYTGDRILENQLNERGYNNIFEMLKGISEANGSKYAEGGKAGEIKDGDSVIMYFNQDTELEIFESEDLDEEPYIDVFKKGEKFEVDIFGVDDTIYDVQFGDGDVAFIRKNNVTIVSVNDKTFAKGGKTGLTKSEISIIDDRIEYYFDNEEYTDDSESLASFVIDGGEIDSSKYKEILQYIESQGYAGDDENDDDEDEYAGGGKTGEIKDGDSVIMYFNQDTELEIFESEDLDEEPYIDVFKKGEKFEVDIFGVDDTIYDVQFGDGDVAFIRKNNVTIVSVNDKTFASGGSVSKGYMVFNYTDNLYATYDVFKTKKLANDFIKEFRNRYSKQGYYRDNQMNKIDVKDIDLLAIPSDFNPLK